MASVNDRRIRDVRDIWNCAPPSATTKDDNTQRHPTDHHTTAAVLVPPDNRTRHKYKTLERHLSMKKTIRKKMMRDLREIGDATAEPSAVAQNTGFLEQIKNDQPPPANIDKPSLWKRLTKGWGHS